MLVMDGWMEGSGEQRREDGRIKKGSWKLGYMAVKLRYLYSEILPVW